jgi:hypothetical protein
MIAALTGSPSHFFSTCSLGKSAVISRANGWNEIPAGEKGRQSEDLTHEKVGIVFGQEADPVPPLPRIVSSLISAFFLFTLIGQVNRVTFP